MVLKTHPIKKRNQKFQKIFFENCNWELRAFWDKALFLTFHHEKTIFQGSKFFFIGRVFRTYEGVKNEWASISGKFERFVQLVLVLVQLHVIWMKKPKLTLRCGNTAHTNQEFLKCAKSSIKWWHRINEKWHNLNEKWHNSNNMWQTQYFQPESMENATI